jgi:tRNA uridine 5-carbamoylmethylation protein Kti12
MKPDFKDLYEFLECAPRPWYILVVGAPGSGKSTLCKALLGTYTKLHRFSTDDKLELIALRRYGTKTLKESQFAKVPFGELIREMKFNIWQMANMGESILIDQTSMSVESRVRKLAWSPPRFTKICIDLHGLTADQCFRRVEQRVRDKGRFIPKHVIEDMLKKYEQPSVDEGFNLIYRLDQSVGV